MGEYYLVVNLDKKQYLRPHFFADGAKLGEFSHNGRGTMAALAVLLLGGLDPDAGELAGTWCGDRIAILGDSSPGVGDITYDTVCESYINISADIWAECEDSGGWLTLRRSRA